ncbi:MAG TPA: helix-turn-helix domain-containing protein [Candidatus Limnocylindrales bacterium]|nr:helix-turn-helix domain-containing protein [Candidatus Limnocylindrales bacterium]
MQTNVESVIRDHRLLAGITRSRLLALLEEAGRPMSIRELAVDVSLHPNSVREQLEPLVRAGLVRRSRSVPHGRGRPALRYAAAPATATGDDAASYRELARVLAGELARRPDAVERAVEAGERWGRESAGGHITDEGPTDSLVALLDANGFAPEPASDDGTIRLRRCPFGPLAREHGEVVCGVHLGLMRGALRELEAPLDAVGLEPFVAPDLCLAHLAPRRTRTAS